MSKVKRGIVVGALTLGMMLATVVPASAVANPKASCVGIVASTTAGELDTSEVKALADALGAPNFGQFVAEGAKLHEGTVEACLPTAP